MGVVCLIILLSSFSGSIYCCQFNPKVSLVVDKILIKMAC